MLFKSNSFRLRLLAVSIALLAVATAMSGQAERSVTKLSEGRYEIEHRQGGGNTTVIIGDRQVFVVDTSFLPSAAREDIVQIRQWTNKPVSFVLNTHFHNDHNFGNRIYMDAFPALTVIAHVETKKEMDRFGPGSLQREEKDSYGIQQILQKMLETGKTQDGRVLTEEDKKEVKDELARRPAIIAELKNVNFQSATLTFDRDLSIDLGNREVQVKFLRRGNTPGDAVVYLSKEKILVAGDLVVHPLPNVIDGYPAEWIHTLQNVAQLDASAIVPGHGPILHDKTYYLLRDLMQSAVDQVNEKLRQTAPAMFQTVDDVERSVDLTPFRQRFAGNDADLAAAFDHVAARLVKLVFDETRSLRVQARIGIKHLFTHREATGAPTSRSFCFCFSLCFCGPLADPARASAADALCSP
jgi:glyoxylase-like metal-dependent hydrolase (beta-lactamase superfamily II)